MPHNALTSCNTRLGSSMMAFMLGVLLLAPIRASATLPQSELMQEASQPTHTMETLADDPTAKAWQAWQLRQIEKAAAMATGVLASEPDNNRARHLRILASYLMGDYEASLTDYKALDPAYEKYDDLGEVITDAYLHLHRFSEAAAHARQAGRSEAIVDWIEKRARQPLAASLDATTILSFVQDDFLSGLMPAIPIALNGQSGVGHLDTGGSFIVMGPEKAASYGIETVQLGSGTANNQTTRVFAGIADSLRLGQALLTNVPVAVVETLQGVGKNMVILGTNIFQQFLTTWDNEEGRLILTPRSSKHQRSMHLNQFASGASEMPFYMASGHYLWATGSVGEQAALYFVDTGLVLLDDEGRQASAGAPGDLLAGWGYDGAGQAFVESRGAIHLGPISRSEGSISVWKDRRNIRPWGELQPDILLSFGFLKHFTWTLDFETHTWYFKPVTQPTAAEEAAGPEPEKLAMYAGQYEVAPGVNLDVSLGQTQLLLQAPGQQKVPMTWVEGATFEIKLAGATVVFEKDASGSVVGLVLKQGGAETRAKKVG